MQAPSFSTTPDPGLDELVVGGPVKTATVTLTDHAGQGALTRGAVLGLSGGVYGRINGGAPYLVGIAQAVLAQDADPSGGDVQALVYLMADVNEDKLNFGGAVVMDDVREALRSWSIFPKKPVSA